MPIDPEYAKRTACRDHAKVYTGELRGSLRMHFFSECRGKSATRTWFSCKFNHTIVNTKRLLALSVGNPDSIITLDYGYGFERYGWYDGWGSGWDITASGRQLHSSGSMQKTTNLPEALLLAEHRLGIAAEVDHEKVQSLCKAHHDGNTSSCRRVDCRYDHDLIESKRMENLVRWPPGDMSDYDALTAECHITNGNVRWKITMKPAAFATLPSTNPLAQTIPSRPFSFEDESLLTVIRHMERVCGLTVIERATKHFEQMTHGTVDLTTDRTNRAQCLKSDRISVNQD
ncbi:hypothetical protein HWV62_38705 [Athelia sp. TMB]|nr:hypothetical protein HWV62_38705 [Athelia sp. TMB]